MQLEKLNSSLSERLNALESVGKYYRYMLLKVSHKFLFIYMYTQFCCFVINFS